MDIKEEYFPRGRCKDPLVGDCTATHIKSKKSTNKSLDKEFVKKQKKESPPDSTSKSNHINPDELYFLKSRKLKKKVPKKNKVTGEELAHLVSGHYKVNREKSVLVDTLTYESLCEGILSLGRVVQVREHELLISLPGRITGIVPITSISEDYTKALEKMANQNLTSDENVYRISEMFEPGQSVIVKVMSVLVVGLKHRVMLSMRPEDIHTNYNALFFGRKGIYTASVVSQEDHGYVMNFGVKGIRAFLPTSGAKAYIRRFNKMKALGIGQLVLCKITHITSQRLLANATLTANPEEVGPYVVPEGRVNYSTLLPGMLVKTIVLNTHKTGIKVYFLDLGGLIHQDHMQDVWQNPLNHELGSEVNSRVLYIMPNGTRPYLSLQHKLLPRDVRIPNSSIVLGEVYTVSIVRYEKRGLVVKFASKEKGIVTHQRCSDDLTYTEENILADFPIGSSHECRILEYSAMDNIYIGSFQLSMLNQAINKISQLSVGDTVVCRMQCWNVGGAVVSIGRVSGFIPLLHFQSSGDRNPRTRYYPGVKFNARIFKLDVSNNKVLLTARKHLMKSKAALIENFDDSVLGEISIGMVHTVKPMGLVVSTMGGIMGFVPASKVSDKPVENILNKFSPGQLVKFKVLEVNADLKKLILTLHFEKVLQHNENGIADSEVPTDKSHKKRKSNHDKEVCSLPTKKRALEVTNLIDGNCKNDIKPDEQINKKKKTALEVANLINGNCENDVTPGKQVNKKKKRASEVANLINGNCENDITPGEQISKKNKRALEVTNLINGNCENNITPGEQINKKKKNESTHKSRDSGEKKNQSTDIKKNSCEKKKELMMDKKERKEIRKKRKKDIPEKNKTDSECNGEGMGEGEELKRLTPELKVLSLGIPVKNFWEVSAIEESGLEKNSTSSSDSEDDEKISNTMIPPKKLDKREKAKAKESAIRKKELALADPNRKPQSIEEFDCLVMGSPNSSLCWIQYMSFYLESANVEMARTVGLRALKTIVFNEDQERLNLWVALLNLENDYGTEESTKSIFQEALRNCDAFKISIHMADIYSSSKKIDEAEKVLITMVKKFKTEIDVWLRIGNLYYRNDKVEIGRKQFVRAITALDKRHRIPLITKYAKLELAYGDPGRGRTMLEQTMANFPNRLDLWISFANILIKYKDIDNARLMFERAVGISFPPKKMRILFRRFLEFENEYGDVESRARVGEKAVAYAENIDLDL